MHEGNREWVTWRRGGVVGGSSPFPLSKSEMLITSSDGWRLVMADGCWDSITMTSSGR